MDNQEWKIQMGGHTWTIVLRAREDSGRRHGLSKKNLSKAPTAISGTERSRARFPVNNGIPEQGYRACPDRLIGGVL